MRSDLIGNCYFWREYYVHSIANHATCSRTFSWPQTEDSTVSIFQMWSAFFSPLQCLEELECSHFTLNWSHSKIEENKKTPIHVHIFSRLLLAIINHKTHWQWTRDKRWTIVNSPRLERQGSHTPLRSHSIWQKVRRKCLEETVKGLETKIFSVDQAFLNLMNVKAVQRKPFPSTQVTHLDNFFTVNFQECV